MKDGVRERTGEESNLFERRRERKTGEESNLFERRRERKKVILNMRVKRMKKKK